MESKFGYLINEYLDSGTFIFNLTYNLISSVFNIALFVLTAIGLYSIAKRRGIRNAWLAWVPVINCWIVGCISDQYRYVVKGQVKSKRKILLVLSIVQCVLTLAVVVLALMMGFNAVNGAMHDVGDSQMMQSVMVAVGGILLLCLPLAGIAIAISVIHYMAMYDLYTSCTPGNNVLFLVLSILVGLTEPFFIFLSRDKDQGMPPRRAPAPEYTPEPPRPAENYGTWNEPEQL